MPFEDTQSWYILPSWHLGMDRIGLIHSEHSLSVPIDIDFALRSKAQAAQSVYGEGCQSNLVGLR